MEKDITHNQEQKKDMQVYESVIGFIKDKDGVHIFRRAEKICKAYFLLTQHIQDNDGLKLKLRNLALDMSSASLDLVMSFNKTEDLVRSVLLKSVALISVSDIALSVRLISETNNALVIQQVQIFMEEIDTYWKTLSYNNQAIPSNLFEMDILDASYKNSQNQTQDNVSNVKSSSNADGMSFKKQINESLVTTSHGAQSNSVQDETTNRVHKNKSTESNGKVNEIKKVLPPSSVQANSDSKNERQSLIINTIKTKGESSIKDLVDVIKGCSEKTIQRELISLVSSGYLLKTGERRWSRYSVAV